MAAGLVELAGCEGFWVADCADEGVSLGAAVGVLEVEGSATGVDGPSCGSVDSVGAPAVGDGLGTSLAVGAGPGVSDGVTSGVGDELASCGAGEDGGEAGSLVLALDVLLDGCADGVGVSLGVSEGSAEGSAEGVHVGVSLSVGVGVVLGSGVGVGVKTPPVCSQPGSMTTGLTPRKMSHSLSTPGTGSPSRLVVSAALKL